MVESSNIREWIVVDDDLVEKVKLTIEAALAYEAATGGKRKLVITSEVGEILLCHQLDLRLMLDPQCCSGCSSSSHVQIALILAPKCSQV